MIDARGLSCPQPVLLLKKALNNSSDTYDIIVDNVTSKENVIRFARNLGYNVDVFEKDGDYTLHIKK